jgi:hypothetical protein
MIIRLLTLTIKITITKKYIDIAYYVSLYHLFIFNNIMV